jgi:hypothetical protein
MVYFSYERVFVVWHRIILVEVIFLIVASRFLHLNPKLLIVGLLVVFILRFKFSCNGHNLIKLSKFNFQSFNN